MAHAGLSTRNRRWICAALSIVVLLAIEGASAAAPEQPIPLYAGKTESPYHALAMELAGALNQPGSGAPGIAVEESQGSIQNVMDAARLAAPRLFTAPPNVIADARRGDKPYGKNPRYRDIRALFPIPFQSVHWVVRQDGDIKTFTDLMGRQFVPGARGSFAERQTTAVLKLLTLDTSIQLIDIDSAAAGSALASKQVVGFATAGAFPIAGLRALAATVPIRLLSLTPDQMKQQLTSDGTTVALTIPKGTYAGVDADVETLALPAGIYTTRQLSNAAAYRITKNFWTGLAALGESAPAWRATTPALLSVLGTRLHPGALKYYREAGIKVPAALR